MKFFRIIFFSLIAICLTGNLISAQGLKSARLKNGLNVFIWEDAGMSNVLGSIAVRVGAADDPEEYTGLAHYLEHLMFKGTELIGSLDWNKERPIYEQIIARYDEMAETTDPVKKKEINLEINRLTVEQSKYSVSNEFSSLVESFGGSALNAGTSYDVTYYHNYFPPSEIEKWLEIYSSRLVKPVFRAFQSELETVYEEYNMGNDEPSNALVKFLYGSIFPESPYARQVIGKGEHLKNPRLSKLIEFYETWYVPENMALILVGNIKAEEALPLINKKFGRLPAKRAPERKTIPDPEIKGRKELSAKIGQFPSTFLAFKGPGAGSPDDILVDFCLTLLTNSNSTGLLDKLAISGDVMGANAFNMNFRDRGRIICHAIPYYDPAQRRYESHKSTEKLLMNEVEKLKKGEVDPVLVENIKAGLCNDYDLSLENASNVSEAITELFIADDDISKLINFKDIVASISMDDIQNTAKKYFGSDYWSLNVQEGTPKKEAKIEKPGFDPINFPGAQSEYAKWFATVPVKQHEPKYIDFNKIKSKKINDLSNLFYTKNTENEIFTLTLIYGIGTEEMPRLKLAANLMNTAGIMAQLTGKEFKEELNKYNASATYGCSGDYLYVRLIGVDKYLAEACNLLTRQILMPALDEKQINNVKGGTLNERFLEKKDINALINALFEYMLYREKSAQINRISESKIYDLSISDLTGEFQRATGYAADIHYVGTLDFDEACEILSKNLPLRANEQASNSPIVNDRAKYSENTIYFLPFSEAEQSYVRFFVEGEAFDISKAVNIKAFNQYFGGGFGSVVYREIREKNSMAYSTAGYVAFPPVQNKNSCFIGTVNTQSDKTMDAIKLYLSLLNELPEYEGRIETIKEYLIQTALSSKPAFRNESQTCEMWKKRGYSDDPAKSETAAFEKLTFDDIKGFHARYLKGKPVAIAVVGDPKIVDVKALEQFGKVTKLSADKIFK
ncbi:MAG: insulinase family protein [Prevotellaceae bacterium]|jgi:predicted Zn-dependent peptidase|nr:insulinase family protein [Prevotellaceae bacterium]